VPTIICHGVNLAVGVRIGVSLINIGGVDERETYTSNDLSGVARGDEDHLGDPE
jgi:hypothetical protein